MFKLSLFLVFCVKSFFCFAQFEKGYQDYSKADSTANFYFGESLDNLPKLALNLTKNLSTEREKFRSIFYWVCQNIESDYLAHLTNIRKRTRFQNNPEKLSRWNSEFKQKFFKKLRLEKKTICTGYAYLVKELCELSGIQCQIVDGYGRNSTFEPKAIQIPNHSWIAAYINEKWYLSDPTWASGYTRLDEKGYVYISEFNEGYFLTIPEKFALNHFPLEEKWSFFEDYTFADFNTKPILYRGAFLFNVFPRFSSTLENSTVKGDFSTITLITERNITQENITISAVKAKKEQAIEYSLDKTTNGSELTFLLPKRGLTDLLIRYKGEPIASFVYKVIKE